MKHTLAVFIASWFYSGFIKPPPFLKGMAGTYGSFFSLPLCWAVYYWGGDNSPFWTGVTIYFVFIIGMMVVPTAEKAIGPRTDWKGKTKSHDQNQIVIDETLGMLITCFPLTFLPVQNIYLALFVAFILFRVFDIIKVPPTRYFDKMKSSAGVMLDDAVAGVYAAIALAIIIQFSSL